MTDRIALDTSIVIDDFQAQQGCPTPFPKHKYILAASINLHQGRAQTGVLHKNYLRSPDRAVKLCRVYVDAMFGETGRRLERVK